MADDVHLWSEELARDPASLVFLPLGEALRRQGQLDLSHKVALRGLQRHPHNAEAHDLMARILADRGELESAYDEWDMVIRIAPGHIGALKGMAYVRFQQGNLLEAEQLLARANAVGGDAGISAAMATVRKSGVSAAVVLAEGELPADPRMLFAAVLPSDHMAMLLDGNGLVLAGAYEAADGRDLAQEIGAGLSGVSDEARRATRHLGIGSWRSIVFETQAAVVSLVPTPAQSGDADGGGLVVLAAAPSTPLGLLRRAMERCVARACNWLDRPAGGVA